MLTGPGPVLAEPSSSDVPHITGTRRRADRDITRTTIGEIDSRGPRRSAFTHEPLALSRLIEVIERSPRRTENTGDPGARSGRCVRGSIHAASTSFSALIEGLKKYPPPVGTTKSLIVTSVAETAPGPNIVQLRSPRSPGTPFWPITMSKPLGLLGRSASRPAVAEEFKLVLDRRLVAGEQQAAIAVGRVVAGRFPQSWPEGQRPAQDAAIERRSSPPRSLAASLALTLRMCAAIGHVSPTGLAFASGHCRPSIPPPADLPPHRPRTRNCCWRGDRHRARYRPCRADVRPVRRSASGPRPSPPPTRGSPPRGRGAGKSLADSATNLQRPSCRSRRNTTYEPFRLRLARQIDLAGSQRIPTRARVAEHELARPHQVLPRKTVQPGVGKAGRVDRPRGDEVARKARETAPHSRLGDPVMEAEVLLADLVQLAPRLLVEESQTAATACARTSSSIRAPSSSRSAARMSSTSASRPGPPKIQLAGLPSAEGSVQSRAATIARPARAGVPGRRTNRGPRHGRLRSAASRARRCSGRCSSRRRSCQAAACRAYSGAPVRNRGGHGPRARLHRLSQGRDPGRDICQPAFGPCYVIDRQGLPPCRASGSQAPHSPGSRHRRGTARQVRDARPPSSY